MAEAGHNSNAQLQQYIERVERLIEERKGISDDIRDVMTEAKLVGFDTKIMREALKLRKMKPEARVEFETIRDTYIDALGLLD